MNASVALAKRCILTYFRDRQSVFFSLMGVLVVVMLYLLFLRDILISTYPDVPGMDDLVDAWVLSGILGIVPVTTCAGALQTMMEDKVRRRDRDILVSPMTPSVIAAGYVLSTFTVGLIMSLLTFVLCVAYLVAVGCPLSAGGLTASLALLVPSALSASIIMYAVTSFLRSSGAFSGLFTVVSILIGFLAGIYMPIGTMPSAMQTIGTLVPASHMAALFRDGMASDALEGAMGSLPAEELTQFRTDMGFDLSLGGFEFSTAMMVLYVVGVTLVFFVIASARAGRRRTSRTLGRPRDVLFRRDEGRVVRYLRPRRRYHRPIRGCWHMSASSRDPMTNAVVVQCSDCVKNTEPEVQGCGKNGTTRLLRPKPSSRRWPSAGTPRTTNSLRCPRMRTSRPPRS